MSRVLGRPRRRKDKREVVPLLKQHMSAVLLSGSGMRWTRFGCAGIKAPLLTFRRQVLLSHFGFVYISFLSVFLFLFYFIGFSGRSVSLCSSVAWICSSYVTPCSSYVELLYRTRL